MRRVFAWLIPLALIAIGVLWPLVINGGSSQAATDVEDPVVFSDYKADYVVNDDGRLDAVETITAEFPYGRHGIFKYWDVTNQNNSRVRQVPDVTSVLLDGKAASYQMLWEDGERFRVAKIGDPDQYLDQRHARLRDPLHRSTASSTPEPQVPTRLSPPRPDRLPPPRRFSSGTSSPRDGTTGSSVPTSRSRCPAPSAGRSVPSAMAWARRAVT